MIYRVNVITGIYRPRVLSVPTFRRAWELRASLSRYRTILPFPPLFCLFLFCFFLFSQKNSSLKRGENFNVGFNVNCNYISRSKKDPMLLVMFLNSMIIGFSNSIPSLDFSWRIKIGGKKQGIWESSDLLE